MNSLSFQHPELVSTSDEESSGKPDNQQSQSEKLLNLPSNVFKHTLQSAALTVSSSSIMAHHELSSDQTAKTVSALSCLNLSTHHFLPSPLVTTSVHFPSSTYQTVTPTTISKPSSSTSGIIANAPALQLSRLNFPSGRVRPTLAQQTLVEAALHRKNRRHTLAHCLR